MRFDRPICPSCQRPARSVVTSLSGRVEIAPVEDGSFERTGQTIRWATERPVVAEGHHLLRCACGEVWPSRRLDEDQVPRDLTGTLPPFSPHLNDCDLAAEPICPDPPSEPDALKLRLKSLLEAKRRNRPKVAPDPPPRYDEVFFRGLAWLDQQ